jgi:hypothetical protein
MQRRISRSKYILAGLITLLVFSLGLTLGIIMDNYRLRWADLQIQRQEMEYASLQFQYLYISSLREANESCAVLNIALEKSTAQLGESLDMFLEYEKRTNLNKEDYKIIRRKYLLDNLRYWLFAERSKRLCDFNTVNVLYFYSEKSCEICPRQGVLLTYYKKIFGDSLLVFPINVDLETEESMVQILRSRYNVTAYPSLIVDDKLYQGVVEKAALGELVCSSFNMPPQECRQNAS